MKKRSKSPQNGEAYVLVYSTDSGTGEPVKKAGSEPKPIGIDRKTIRPAIRIEKKGRGGKTVTILFNLPPHETLSRDLCAFLKKGLGCGGTSYVRDGSGVVELQGDRRDEIPALLDRYRE